MHRMAMKRCMRRAALCVGGVVAGAAGLLWHETHADTVMARVQHSRVLCAVHLASLSDAASGGILPGMMAIDLVQSEDGRIMVASRDGAATGLQHLADVLRRARATPNMLLMLNVHDIEPSAVAALVRHARMVDRVILNEPDLLGAEAAFSADPQMLVAMPVHTAREIHHAHTMAHGHPYALYVQGGSDAHLFAQAHHDASVVIASNIGMTETDRSRLVAQPIDVLVTDEIASP